ncbi:MAG: hypothetical protein NTZ74_00720 [Chloroflexi bacterium]|nr:hypothetical protein [Chloroflexota bacterium]
MTLLQVYFSLHMIGIVIWLGAALILPLALIPALKSLEGAAQAKFLLTFTKRYIPWLIVSWVLVGVTGVLQVIFPDLAEEMSGSQVLIVKHAFILPLIAVSTYLWFFLAKKLGQPKGERTKFMQQFVGFSWLQALLSVAVLILTGILTG